MIFLVNILLALAWVALTGQVTVINFTIGFGLGTLLLWFGRHTVKSEAYFTRTWAAFKFVAYFLWQILLANLRVTYDILSPAYRMSPAVIDIPLDLKQPGQITLLANLITLTPGTLSLDVSDDQSTLYVHTMHLDDPDQFRREIKQGFERYIREVFG